MENYTLIIYMRGLPIHDAVYRDPIAALHALTIFSDKRGGFTYDKAVCFREIDGVPQERQWLLQVD